MSDNVKRCRGLPLRGRFFKAFYRFDHLGDYFKGVAYDTVVGCFEEWGLRVFVDNNDDLTPVHSGEMLDGSGNADGDIEVGGDSDACLSNVFVVWAPVRVCHGAAASSGGAEEMGQFFDHSPVLGSFQATAAADDEFGLRQGYLSGGLAD